MPDKAAQALRRFCLECQGGHVPSVGACADTGCLLYPWRRCKSAADPASLLPAGCAVGVLPGMERPSGDGALPASPAPDAPAGNAGLILADAPAGNAVPEPPDDKPVRVIRRFCLSCAGNRRDVRECDAKDSCPLWSYRFGVFPATFKRVVIRQKKRRTELSLPGLS